MHSNERMSLFWITSSRCHIAVHFGVVAKQIEVCGADVGVGLFDQLYHFNFKLIIFPPQLC